MRVKITRFLERFNPLERGEWIYELEGAAWRLRNLFAFEYLDERSAGAQFFPEREIGTGHLWRLGKQGRDFVVGLNCFRVTAAQGSHEPFFLGINGHGA